MNSAPQKTSRRLLLAFLLLVGLVPRVSFAIDHYVNVNNSTPSAPYTNWATAATIIQDAVDAATAGDVVWVANGTYNTGGRAVQAVLPNRVAIDRPITVQSVNGPQLTIIQGHGGFANATRCAYLTNGALLSGFTLKNGFTTNGGDFLRNQCGGGVFCESASAVVSNCMILSGAAAGEGGGVFSGTLNNCTVSGNSALQGGGANSSVLNKCTLNGNSATWGGGADNSTLNNCTIAGNSAADPSGSRVGYGGGADSSKLQNCLVANNSARYEGGGVSLGALTNCLVVNNIAVWAGGVDSATVVNCTIVGNTAYDDGGIGGGGGGGVLSGSVFNSIIVQNTGPYGGPNFWYPHMVNCCTSPDPGGTNNIVADPLFTDYANGNYRPQAGSPCVDTGTNGYTAVTVDLDGAPRVVDDVVDMGAYELQHALLVIGNPADQSVVLTSNATFSVSAIGDVPRAYQWSFNGTPLTDGGRINGANSNSLTIAVAQTNDAGNYQVVVTNNSSTTTSSVATLTVLLPVTITSQPANKTVSTNVTVSFTVTATGLAALGYSWYSNNIALTNGGRISGANSATLNISNTQTNDAATYYVVVTNIFGSLTSSNAILTVVAPVQIIGQPASQAVLLTSNATFAVTAAGTETLGYRWFFNGTLLSDDGHINGSTTPILTISNVQPGDAGGYVARVTNLWNSATSHVASLTALASASSSVRYVNISNTTPAIPYLSWDTAATNIQDAIDAAVAGDLVLVSNGVYSTGGRVVYGETNRVAVDKALTVQSINGAASTRIVGSFSPTIGRTSGRCVYLTNGAVLSGFTLTNGSAGGTEQSAIVQQQSGGGVWCESSSAVVSNCVLAGNVAGQFGGGAFQGTLFNCFLTNNTASKGGGACSNLLINCTLMKNIGTFQNVTSGGGAIYSTLSNCLLVANACNGGGGGAAFCTLTSCVLSNNTSGMGGAVCMGTATYCLISSNRTFTAGGGAYSNILNNCVLRNNLTVGNGGGAYGSTLANCTVVSNSTPSGSGAGGGLYYGSASNSIVYYNFSLKETNFLSSMALYCCCVPSLATNGMGNITNAPAFTDLVGADFHLLASSPCINSGNNSLVPTAKDFDGNLRMVGGSVDIGAYEFQTPASALSYAWAQQHGLPADGSADYLDADGDGLNNWQEWRAGTDPNDAASRLAMLPTPITNPGTITVTWASVSGVPYYVQRSTNLTSQPFLTIQSNIIGQVGTTSYIDSSATNDVPFLYRVGVQH